VPAQSYAPASSQSSIASVSLDRPDQATDHSLYGNAYMASQLSQAQKGPKEKASAAQIEAAESEFSPLSDNPELAKAQGARDDLRALGTSAKSLFTGEYVDIDSAKDRQKAKHELATQFEIVPDDHQGARRPNTLTESEYRETAGTFSDIRRDKTDIGFMAGNESDTADFRAESMNDIATIQQTPEGRAVVSQLANNKDDHKTVLSPAVDPNAPRTNAFGGTEGGWKDGTGQNAVIQYEPGHAYDGKTQDEWAQGTRSDVLLYHEMVHAKHFTRGESVPGKVGDGGVAPVHSDDHGVNIEEYDTTGLNGRGSQHGDLVLTENAYRQSRREIEIGAHSGDKEMPLRTQYNPSTTP
jgi:hypothetical protein